MVSHKRSSNKGKKRSSSKKSSSKVRIPVLHKGSLSKFGWKSTDTVSSRHKSLKKALKEFSSGQLIKKLNLLAIYNKNKNPILVRKCEADIKYLQDL